MHLLFDFKIVNLGVQNGPQNHNKMLKVGPKCEKVAPERRLDAARVPQEKGPDFHTKKKHKKPYVPLVPNGSQMQVKLKNYVSI